MSNFFNNNAFNGNGFVSGFSGTGAHTSTFNNDVNNHLTFDKPYNSLGHTHDFSLETTVRLNGFNQMGGLEQRTTFLDTFNNSPFNNY